MITPTIRSKGIFQVKAPWTLEAGAIYECEAIRSFEACYERGMDVETEIYLFKDLEQSVYREDSAKNAHIITLRSDTHPTVYIPDTYILSYPGMGVTDQRIIASVDLGILKTVVSLDYLASQLRNVASDVAGVSATVKFHRATLGGVPSEMESTVNDQVREHTAASNSSDYLQLKEANERATMLEEKVKSLENIIGNINP